MTRCDKKDINLVRFIELVTSGKRYVNSLKLIGMKKKRLYRTGAFELIGSTLIGEIEQKKLDRKVDGFETYINASDIDYYSEDVFFTMYKCINDVKIKHTSF